MTRKVLLIGWDAADWKVASPLLDAGEMPNLERLVDGGVCGNLATLRPVLSPMLWTSIATGKRAYKHGIFGFVEPNPETRQTQPISVLSRKSKALWNILQQRELRSHVVGWWPSHPAEPISGVMVSNRYEKAGAASPDAWPMPPGTVHPESWRERLEPLRVHPGDLSRMHLEPFVPQVAQVDPAEDKRLGGLASTLAECASVQAAATAVIEDEPWDLMAVYFDAIDHAGHGFMKYHPPRQEWIEPEDYERYQHVVRSMYRFHDMMLGALLERAGDDVTTIIVSDHGFHPDHLRPHHIPNVPAGPAAEHRHYGMLVMHGPGIRSDERVHGATLLDVTPTILQLFDLPVGRDMDGKVIATAFETAPEVQWIDSWEAVEGPCGQHGPEARTDAVESHESLNQLVALGYVDAPPDDGQAALDQTSRELSYNRALSLIDGNLGGEAAPILARLWQRWPEQSRFGMELFGCQLALGRLDEAEQTLGELVRRKAARSADAARELREFRERHPDLHELDTEQKREFRKLHLAASTNRQAFAFMRSRLLQSRGEPARALAVLERIENPPVTSQPSLWMHRAQLLLELDRFDEAEASCTAVLEVDPTHAGAELGIARCRLAQGRAEEAAVAARTSLGLLFHNPRAHHVHAMALLRLGDVDTAIRAFETAIAQNPNFAEPHRQLSEIFAGPRDEPERAERHRRLAEEAQARVDAARSTATNASDLSSFSAPPFPRSLPAEIESAASDAAPDEWVTIVSGLPRSGTSMMMQMLRAGGLDVFTDERREADAHNPKGYLESDRVRSLRDDASWLPQAQGKAVKVIAQLLPHLDPALQYRVLFMERNLEEVVASQSRMLEDADGPGAVLDPSELARTFVTDVEKAQALVSEAPNILAIGVDYHEVLQAPDDVAERVARFLGNRLDADAMARAVDPALHRVQRDAD